MLMQRSLLVMAGVAYSDRAFDYKFNNMISLNLFANIKFEKIEFSYFLS